LLASNPSFEVYLLGGQLQFEVPGIVGSFALEMLKAFYYQTGFIGVRAISLKEGLMTRTIDQAACSQAILNQSHKKVVIADSSKFYRQAGAKITALSEIDVLITDRGVEQNPDLMEQICAFPNLELIVV
jgi:DeoR family glycerol-3-phosphate regulon repressor